jgi:hypothetical protein
MEGFDDRVRRRPIRRATRPDDDIYLVEFLAAERLTGERAWLREIDLCPARDKDPRVTTT